MKRILLFTLLLAFTISGCNKSGKKTAAPVVDNIQEELVEATDSDTIYQEEVFEEAEPEFEPLAPDKYFLITASFRKYENAQKYQEELRNKGMRSEIIQRNYGPNNQYYRVSYMSFSDKAEALRTMRNERTQQGKEKVWILSRE